MVSNAIFRALVTHWHSLRVQDTLRHTKPHQDLMNNEHYSKTHLNMTKITEFSNSLKRHCMTHCFIASYCFDIGLPAPANWHWASSARNAEEGIAGSSPRKLRNSRLPFVTNQWSTLNHRLRDKKPKTYTHKQSGRVTEQSKLTLFCSSSSELVETYPTLFLFVSAKVCRPIDVEHDLWSRWACLRLNDRFPGLFLLQMSKFKLKLILFES